MAPMLPIIVVTVAFARVVIPRMPLATLICRKATEVLPVVARNSGILSDVTSL
jgi:hypothetical protein